VVAGDVWWFSDMTPAEDEMAWDQKKLEESRKKVLEIADWIIPGHGGNVRESKGKIAEHKVTAPPPSPHHSHTMRNNLTQKTPL